MKVRELMTSDVFTLEEDASVGVAMAALDEHGVRHIPILKDGAVVGMLSDRDLRRVDGLLALTALDPERSAPVLSAPVASLLSGDALSVDPDTHVDELIDIFLDEGVGAVVVMDEGETLLGIVSYVDVLREAKGRFG